MPVGKTVKQVMLPLYKSQNQVAVVIYSARRGDPLCCYETGVNREAEIVVKIPADSGVDRPVSCLRASTAVLCSVSIAFPQVEVSMKFGDTMIEVTAVDKTTGAEQSVSVTFAKQYK